MNFHYLTVLILTLFTLVGCGEDVAKNKSSRDRATKPPPTTTAVGGDSILLNSQIHRLRGMPVLTTAEEIDQIVAGSLPVDYRVIPDMGLDDEGKEGKNVITITSLGRPGVTCGVSGTFAGFQARISDCATKNGDKALWNGQTYGAAGEGTWQLVARTSAGLEVWYDLHTGLLWSDVINAKNWCKASGNLQPSGTSLTINCATAGESVSLCRGANVAGLGADFRWRLPTRNDYLQADLDGIRSVMELGATSGSWTATMEAASENRSSAWVYRFQDGTLVSSDLLIEHEVRCVGVPLK